jgi:hypothetical protein
LISSKSKLNRNRAIDNRYLIIKRLVSLEDPIMFLRPRKEIRSNLNLDSKLQLYYGQRKPKKLSQKR